MKAIFAAAALAASQFAIPQAHAAEFTDKAIETQFSKGTLRLQYSMFGKGISGGAELKQLYDEKRWPELVQGVAGKQFVSDLYYFYLGAAAEDLGHGDAAQVYYAQAIAASRGGNSCNAALDNCRGLAMPATAAQRLDALANAENMRDTAVAVVSAQGQPVTGARVESTGARSGASCTTGDSGACKLSLKLRADETFGLRASKEGMFASSVMVPAKAGSQTVTLRAYRDMMCDDLKSAGAASQAALVERQVGAATALADLSGASLEAGGICTSTFKKANYLSFKLYNNKEYNEGKQTSYMIGTTVFDEVVRRILLSMSPVAPDMKTDGYDIAVASTKRDFASREALPKPVNFRFYFPRQLVAKYQDKDISGQQLLDGSVILLNDDRVDLKLQ